MRDAERAGWDSPPISLHPPGLRALVKEKLRLSFILGDALILLRECFPLLVLVGIQTPLFSFSQEGRVAPLQFRRQKGVGDGTQRLIVKHCPTRQIRL